MIKCIKATAIATGGLYLVCVLGAAFVSASIPELNPLAWDDGAKALLFMFWLAIEAVALLEAWKPGE